MSWSYRRMCTVYSDTGNVEINYPIKLTVVRSTSPSEPSSGSKTIEIASSKSRSDFRDIRFVINNRIVPHYDHTGSGNSREFYIKIPRLLPDIGTDIYIYYGNTSMIVTNSSVHETITYMNHLMYGNLGGITLTGTILWADVGRAHPCPIMKYGMTNYGVLNTQNAFNKPVMGYTVEIPAAFGSGGNTSVLLFNGSNLIGVRRSATNTSRIVAEYNADTVHNIDGVGNEFNIYGFHFYNNMVYYTFNGVTYGSHASSNNNTYIVMMGNSAHSTSEVTADYILVRKSAWNIYGEMIHVGDWSSEESGGFWCLPYDTTFDDLKMYIDGRNRLGDSVQNPASITTSDTVQYGLNRFDVLNESILFTSESITSNGSYNFLHQSPCQSTVFFWVKPTTNGCILDTGHYKIEMDELFHPSLTITNVCSGTFTNTLVQNEWNAVCIKFDNDINSGNATCYTATLSSDIITSTLNKTGSVPSTSTHTTCTLGKTTSGSMPFQGALSECMIFSRSLLSEECISLITRTRNGYIYPVMNNTRSVI